MRVTWAVGGSTRRYRRARSDAVTIAAAMRGLSVAGFVEWLVGRALVEAGLIEQPTPEGP
jgi:hypothetical protein